MAINYDTLFADLGKIVLHTNVFEEVADTDIPAAQTDLSARLGTLASSVGDIPSILSGFVDTVDGWRSSLGQMADARLLDYDTVTSQLSLTPPSLANVLAALVVDMGLQSESVAASAVTVGSSTAASGNVGNAVLIGVARLDGLTSPVRNAPANAAYVGLASQLANTAETFTATCVRDSYSGSASSGAETWQLVGGQQRGDAFSSRAGGSGSGGTLSTLQAGSVVSNGDFETFSTNTPGSWTIAAGTAGVHIFQDTTGGNYKRGSRALKLTGDSVQGSIRLTQTPTSSVSLKGYLLAVWVKASASISQGDLTISCTGTGYTAPAGEKISIAAADLPTSWTLYTRLITVPLVKPSDWKLSISWDGTPTTGKSVWIDNLAFAPPLYHGGVAWGVLAGSTRDVLGDVLTVAVENDGAGLFQEYFRRRYGVQLPSSGSPTQANALAK